MDSGRHEEAINRLRAEFLTIKEVIYVTKLSRTTIWQLCRSGKLERCTNTGRRVLIPAWSVLACFNLDPLQRSNASRTLR